MEHPANGLSRSSFRSPFFQTRYNQVPQFTDVIHSLQKVVTTCPTIWISPLECVPLLNPFAMLSAGCDKKQSILYLSESLNIGWSNNSFPSDSKVFFALVQQHIWPNKKRHKSCIGTDRNNKAPKGCHFAWSTPRVPITYGKSLTIKVFNLPSPKEDWSQSHQPHELHAYTLCVSLQSKSRVNNQRKVACRVGDSNTTTVLNSTNYY